MPVHRQTKKQQHASSQSLAAMSHTDVTAAYKRWAPIYDFTFAKLVRAGMLAAVKAANHHSGRLLDVGVGTGTALPHYSPGLAVTGIDYSHDMLVIARRRLSDHKVSATLELLHMDAAALDFPDAHFDVSVAMYVLTVVPDPQQVIAEMCRVTRPGGQIIIVNHFSVDTGLRGLTEKALSKYGQKLGWRPVFPLAPLLEHPRLRLLSQSKLPPLGLFTLLQFENLGPVQANML